MSATGPGPSLPDYRILAAPRINETTFGVVLEHAGSPAASVSAACYALMVRYGVDPALGLAIFGHESGYGRAGVAVRSLNWGNLRTAPGYRTAADGFVHFPDWPAGAAAAARLLASPLYGASQAYATARTFPFRWAPSADHNNPAAYGADVAARIAAYIAMEGPTMLPIAAGGLTIASSYVIDLPAGAVIFDHDGHELTKAAAAMTVEYLGLPLGGGAVYAVLIATAVPYGDGRVRPTVVYVGQAVHPRPKTAAELAATAARYGGADPAKLAAAADALGPIIAELTPPVPIAVAELVRVRATLRPGG